MSCPPPPRSSAPLATVAAGLMIGWLLIRSGVEPTSVVVFTLYVIVVLAAPGCLVWWLLTSDGRGDQDNRLHAGLVLWVCGTSTGVALDLSAYVLMSALGSPRSHPIVVLGIAGICGVMIVRRRQGERSPTPHEQHSWAPWILGLICAYFVWWMCDATFPLVPLDTDAIQDTDEPFHLALVAELRHHFPPSYPHAQEAGRLTYQWFVHAQMAAASWTTGLEPVVIYRRFDPIFFGLLTVLGAASMTSVLSKRWGPRIIAPAILVFIGSFDVSGVNPGQAAPEERFLLGGTLINSPTQSLAFALSIPSSVLILELVRRGSLRPGQWTLLAFLLSAMAGAKVTFLPMFASGVIAAALVAALRRSGGWKSMIGLLFVITTIIVTSGWVLYGGSAQSLALEPSATVRFFEKNLGVEASSTGAEFAFGVGLLLSWLLCGAGAVGLFVDRATRWDPRTWWILGVAASGYGATMLLGHGGNSQLYFGRSAAPYVAVASAYGLARLFPSPVLRRDRITALAVAGGAGLLLFGVRSVTEGMRERSDLMSQGELEPVLRASANLPVVLSLLVLLWLLSVLLRDLSRGRIRLPLRYAVVFLVGLGFARTVAFVSGGFAYRDDPNGYPVIGVGGMEAARWLREHSSPAEVIATNAHCGIGAAQLVRDKCDARHFWVAAYSERRILLEGWAYTRYSTADWTAPYWGADALLEMNDAAFEADGDASRKALLDKGIRWLFMDDRAVGEIDELAGQEDVRLRHREGHFAVFEITPGASDAENILGLTSISNWKWHRQTVS